MAVDVLPAAQFATVSGSAACADDDTTPATYTGTFTTNIEMTTLMASHESDMEMASSRGFYPWNVNRTGIAFIVYTVTLPADATIGSVAASETSSMIGSVSATTSGNTVTIKAPLHDVNWTGILADYNADKADPAAHTVKVTIPYTITADSQAAAQQAEAQNITASGDFTFRTGGFFGFNTTYTTDTASLPAATNFSTLTCLAPEPTPDPTPNPTPDPTPNPTSDPTPVTPDTPIEVTQSGELPGDLLGAEGDGAADTEHDAVFQTSSKDAQLSLTGALYTDSIKNQMAAIETQYGQTLPDFATIALSNVDYGFTATMTLPEGMTYTDASSTATLAGSSDFEVTNVTIDGQTANVSFALTEAAKATIATYADLKAIVDATESPLTVTIQGVTFTDASTPETNYTVTGNVTGHFTALASKSAATGGRDIQFGFTWNAVQKDGLQDANTQPGITFTTAYPAPAEPTDTPTEPAEPTAPATTPAEPTDQPTAPTSPATAPASPTNPVTTPAASHPSTSAVVPHKSTQMPATSKTPTSAPRHALARTGADLGDLFVAGAALALAGGVLLRRRLRF